MYSFEFRICSLLFFISAFYTSYASPAASILKYGAKPNDNKDDTRAIQTALDINDNIYIPKGEYLVTAIEIKDNKTIFTDSYKTIITQLKGNSGKQIFRITGSNVTLYPISFKGNIATDSGEFNIAIMIGPPYPFNTNTKNITIKGFKGYNLRGDGICIGNASNSYAENVTVNNVYVKNCYRNGISIVGGKNIKINNVKIINSGMEGIDIEGEGGCVLDGIKINNLVAGNICISGGDSRAKNVVITNVKLNGLYQQSTPKYKAMNPSGILIYNAENVKFENTEITNMPEFAIFCGDIEDKKQILSTGLSFSNITIDSSNSLLDNKYNCAVLVMGADAFIFNKLKLSLAKKTFAFLGKKSSFENTQKIIVKNSSISTGSFIGKYCEFYSDSSTIQSNEYCFDEMNSVVFNNSKITSKLLFKKDVDDSKIIQKSKNSLLNNKKIVRE
jgi:hypothetical protein